MRAPRFALSAALVASVLIYPLSALRSKADPRLHWWRGPELWESQGRRLRRNQGRWGVRPQCRCYARCMATRPWLRPRESRPRRLERRFRGEQSVPRATVSIHVSDAPPHTVCRGESRKGDGVVRRELWRDIRRRWLDVRIG